MEKNHNKRLQKENSFNIPDNYNNLFCKKLKLPEFKKNFEFEFPRENLSIENLKDEVNLLSFNNGRNEPYQKLKENSPIVKISIHNVSSEENQNNIEIKRLTTGNYCGIIFAKPYNIIIESRFGDAFLKRMLNVLNDVYIQTEVVEGKLNHDNPFLQILIYLFIQSLEKASILGLPREYKDFKHNEYKVRGRLDINNIVRRNIPFTGKISSISREQTEVEEIAEVINYTINKCDRYLGSNNTIIKRINNVRNTLKSLSKNIYPDKFIIDKAKKHRVLQNPVFSEYKNVLKYAELIINMSDIYNDKKQNNKSRGYIFDVSELFEIYIEKILRHNLQGWSVKAQEKINTYKGTFFAREIRPDLVLEKDDKVLVFDTKYKRMNYRGSTKNDMGDVDRTDFFQIHTYMAHYFDESKNTKLVAGGLLYPIEGIYKEVKTDKWLGNTGNFIIDGINLNGLTDSNFKDEISARENKFVNSIKTILT
jgi:5-methylcytosine-specific restriction endonuclease McrBC regulatory subunit McrC